MNVDDVSPVVIVLVGTILVEQVVGVSYPAAFVVVTLGVAASKSALSSVSSRISSLTADDQDERRDEPVGAREAREAYVAGEIDDVETLERRLDRAFDPNVRAIRERFEPIDGIGRETCFLLADHFGTLDAIENATVDELEQVDGIGPARATELANGSTSKGE